MPKVLRDFQGLEIRLTDERLAPILEHPEMNAVLRVSALREKPLEVAL